MAQSTTPNIAQWDWNPGTTFIGAAKVAHGMMMANQESERLQQKQTLDEEVKRALLPYEIEESKAKVALSMAQRDYALSRARDDAKTMTAASIRAAAYNDPEAVNKGEALLFGAPENRSSSGGSSLNLNDTDINSSSPLLTRAFSPDESSDVFAGLPSSAPTVASSPAPAQGSAPVAESEPFLTSDFNPATSLSSPELSQAPKELTTSTEGGPMVFNSSRGKKALQDQADIKRLAKSGDTQAASFVNPLGDSPSTNPLDNFNVPTSVKEMERTLAENKDAFAGPKQKAPESLSSKISSFNSVMGNAEKKLRTLKQANPAAHIQGSLAYQERYSNFLEDNFKGMDSDEVGYLMKNPSKADRYLSYKSDGAEPDEAHWLSGIATTDAKAIVELKTNGTIHGKPLEGIPTIESFGHAKDVYDQYKKQGIKPTEDKTVDEIAKLNTTRDGVNAMPEGPSKTALLEVLDKKENDLTGGKANYNRHVDMEKGVSTALASSNDRNLNYRGLRFDSPEAKEDPKGQLSGNDFLIEAAGNGSLPTVTIGKDGFNTSAADAYLKKHGVDSTPVGIWESGKLNAYRFTPSAEKGKQFVPIMVKGPEVAKKSVDGNPFAAQVDGINAKAEGVKANNSREENEKKYVQLYQTRNQLLAPEPKREAEFRFGGAGLTLQRGSVTPEEEAVEKRNSWDKQTARIQAVEKQLGTFDPEGSGYDIKTAVAAGMEPDSKTKHWGSVRKSTPDEIKKYGVPEDSYLLLKGAKHPTHNLAVQYEAQRGFEIKKIGDRYFSIPVKK